MLVRASVLSFLILVTVAASLPFGESLAAFGQRAAASRSGKRHYRRRSHAWRARRRAHLRRQRALAAARRRRQRAWVLRKRRAAARRATVARTRRPQTLRSLLAPMRLPTASPSAVESIQSVGMRIAAPSPLAAPQTSAPQTFVPQFAAPQAAATQAATQAVSTQPAALQFPTRQTPLAQLAPARSLAHAAAPRPNHTLPAVVVQPPAPPPVTLASPAVSAAPLAAATPFNARAPFAAAPAPTTTAARPAQRITGLPVPRSWQAVSSTLAGEFKFSVRTAEGRAAGAAVWSRVALPAATGQDRRNKTLGGVSHTALRRTVIDRMIAEGGWVVNDFERQINGQRVFVVFAQSEGERGARRTWTYYFTEADGLVYSLATTTSSEFADAVAADAEQTLSAVLSRTPAAQKKK